MLKTLFVVAAHANALVLLWTLFDFGNRLPYAQMSLITTCAACALVKIWGHGSKID